MNIIQRYTSTDKYKLRSALIEGKPKTLLDVIRIANDRGFKLEVTDMNESSDSNSVSLFQTLGYK